MRRLLSWIKGHKGESISVLAVFCLTLASALAFTFWPREIATSADVVLEGKLIQKLDLTQDQECPVSTKYGEVLIEVYKHGVSVHSSPCPNQSCVHQGVKTKAGESIICAHCSLVITLVGGEVMEVVV